MRIFKNLIICIFGVAILTSACVSSTYYQIYSIRPQKQIEEKQNLLVYEDQNCKITYNFWSEFGDVGFWFYNKTDKNIYLNMEQSFFILNGVAYDYYLNRVYSYGKSLSLSTNQQIGYKQSYALGAYVSKSATDNNYSHLLQTNQVGAAASVSNTKTTTSEKEITTTKVTSISFTEEKIVCIPPNSSKRFAEYYVNEAIFRSCDLLRFPKNTDKDKKAVTFNSEAESPFVFSNRIAYSCEGNSQTQYIDNSFYVDKIENFNKKDVFSITWEYDGRCGEKIIFDPYKSAGMRIWKIPTSPNMFYMTYKKDGDKDKF